MTIEPRRRSRLRWGLVLGWAAATLWMSTDVGSGHTTGSVLEPLLAALGFAPAQVETVHALLRSLGHVLAYGGFAVLVWRALEGRLHRVPVALGAAAVLAIVDEIVQGFVPTRTGDVRDVLLDATGAALALWFVTRRRSSGVGEGLGGPTGVG